MSTEPGTAPDEKTTLVHGGTGYNNALNPPKPPAVTYHNDANTPDSLHHRKTTSNKYIKAGFFALEITAIMINIGIAMVQVVPLFDNPASNQGEKFRRSPDYQYTQTTFEEWVQRVLIGSWCLVMILAEARVPLPYFQSYALQSFLGRGFIYVYLGNTCFVQSSALELREYLAHRGRYFISWGGILLKLAGYAGVILGFLYAVLGVLCLKHLMKWAEKKEEEEEKNHEEPADNMNIQPENNHNVVVASAPPPAAVAAAPKQDVPAESHIMV